MDRSDIADLYDYDAWATKRLLDAAAALPAEQLTQDLGASFGSLFGTLVHTFAGHRLWMDRWKGNSPKAMVGPDRIPTLGDLQQRWEHYRVEFEDYIRLMNDDNMKEKFSYVDFQGQFREMALHWQMLHVVMHSAYHRAQAAAQLRQLGAEPPETGLMTYLMEKQA